MQRAAHPDESIEIVSYRDLCAHQFDSVDIRKSSADKTSSSLTSFDALLVRSMPLGSLEQVIFRVNALHAVQLQGLQVLNAPRTLEIAIDKWLTLSTVAKQGIAVPKTIVCQNREQALDAFELLNRDVVVKPLFGGEGRGLMRVSCPDLAWRIFGTLEVNQSVIYLQEFVPHYGFDLRIFVLGDRCFAMKRTNDKDWRTNVARGGNAEKILATKQQIDIAQKAAQALSDGIRDAAILGIDLLPAKDGRLLLIEVNAVPGWKALAKALDIDISRCVLDYLRTQAT